MRNSELRRSQDPPEGASFPLWLREHLWALSEIAGFVNYRQTLSDEAGISRLLHLRELGLRFLQNRNIRVGFSPAAYESLIRRFRLGRVPGHGKGPGDLKVQI